MKESLRAQVKSLLSEDEVIQITQELIRIPSHPETPDREKEIANYLYTLFQKEGIQAELQIVKDDTPNIIATLKGNQNASAGAKSLMLNGHIDTVAPVGMDKPYDPVIKDGILYGRGACDMKAGVAAMAYALILLHRAKVQLAGDLYFCGVIEEDCATSAGSRFVVENGPFADYGIVGEPTQLKVVTAHKGIDYFCIKVRGVAAHSSKPTNGANAIYAAAEIVLKIESDLVSKYNAMHHPMLGAPTINTGLIQGSAASNKGFLLGTADTYAGTVADECDIYLDVRWTPQQSVDTIMQDLQELCSKVTRDRISIDVEYIPLPRPAVEVDADNNLVRAACAHAEMITGEKQEPVSAGFWTDAGLFYGLRGIPTIVCGPGDVSYAHGPDEQVKIGDISKAALLYAYTALDICI